VAEAPLLRFAVAFVAFEVAKLFVVCLAGGEYRRSAVLVISSAFLARV
jgi:hypothetical protein